MAALIPGFHLSLKRGPGCAQVEDRKGSDLGVRVSHCCNISQGPFISRKQRHPAAPTSPDRGSLPLPSLPLSPPPSPADSHSHSPPDAGDRLGQARDILSFPSLLPLPGVIPSSSPPSSLSALSLQDPAGVGARGVDRRGVHRRLTVVRPELLGQDALTRTLEQQRWRGPQSTG